MHRQIDSVTYDPIRPAIPCPGDDNLFEIIIGCNDNFSKLSPQERVYALFLNGPQAELQSVARSQNADINSNGTLLLATFSASSFRERIAELAEKPSMHFVKFPQEEIIAAISDDMESRHRQQPTKVRYCTPDIKSLPKGFSKS